MRVAIVQDELVRRGGAEQVVLSMLKAFPNADVYTMCYNANNTFPEYKNYKIHTSLFQHLTTNARTMQLLFFPIGIICMKLMKVRNYDIVIVSNTHCAKYVSISKTSKVFMYTYTPFRLAWNPESYTEYNTSKGIKRLAFNIILNMIKRIDKHESEKGHYFMGMTKETVQRIKNAYQVKNVEIIPPPVKIKNFHISDSIEEFYLVVSRLEYYKKVDLVVEVFNKLNLPLIIVGNGSKKHELMDIAKPNIQFKSGLSAEEIAELYAKCKAFIFPQHEDYGITPLEANASGRPVIAYQAGGVLETMIPYKSIEDNKFTSYFFNQQTSDSLEEAILEFEKISHLVDSDFIRNHAMKFDEPVFNSKLKAFIDNKIGIDIVKFRNIS